MMEVILDARQNVWLEWGTYGAYELSSTFFLSFHLYFRGPKLLFSGVNSK